jgi:survival-of-motor-neuron-related-splicing factor 30
LQARYYADGKYYPGKITSLTPYGSTFLFDGYGNTEEVPYLYLRPIKQEVKDTKASAAAKVDDNKLIEIPAHLHILPTDSEADKERKRKRFVQIRYIHLLLGCDVNIYLVNDSSS